MNFLNDFSTNVNFIEKHVGGNSDDSITNYKNQKNIINNTSDNYERLIDYQNKLSRSKNDNNEFIERLDNELHTSVYRLNNVPTTIQDVNYTNPIIFPKEHDPYFEYLNKKNIMSLNTQVVKKKQYINKLF